MEFLLPGFLIGLVAALTVVLIGALMLRGGVEQVPRCVR